MPRAPVRSTFGETHQCSYQVSSVRWLVIALVIERFNRRRRRSQDLDRRRGQQQLDQPLQLARRHSARDERYTGVRHVRAADAEQRLWSRHRVRRHHVWPAAGPFTLGGNSITLGGNIADNTPLLTQTVNLPLILGLAPDVLVANDASLTLGGAISGRLRPDENRQRHSHVERRRTHLPAQSRSAAALRVNGDENLGAAPASPATWPNCHQRRNSARQHRIYTECQPRHRGWTGVGRRRRHHRSGAGRRFVRCHQLHRRSNDNLQRSHCEQRRRNRLA